MYTPAPSAAELAAFGLREADFDEADGLPVWPCNHRAVVLFGQLGTQWRTGFSGAYGLDYTAVQALMGLQGVKKSIQAALFEDIRVMEQAVLALWSEREQK